MLVQSHDTGGLVELQALSLVGDPWATAVVPRLPANLAAQARVLKALQRVRGLATPHDLLRGVLASVVGPLSTRRSGAWASWWLLQRPPRCRVLAQRAASCWWTRAPSASLGAPGTIGGCIWPTISWPAGCTKSASRTAVAENTGSGIGGTLVRSWWWTAARAIAAGWPRRCASRQTWWCGATQRPSP